MNQVKETRISKAIEGILMLFNALSVNEEISEEIKENKELEKILKSEDTNKIKKLEEQTTSVNIPLKDSEKIAPKAKVSEEMAQKRANRVREEKKITDENRIRE